MNTTVKTMAAVLAALTLALAAPASAETDRGKPTGGIAYALPDWFKASFLDFPADVQEARKQNKHVMVFLHLNECPYCARMLKDNFVSGDNRDFIQKNFDVIGINIRGSQEVAWIDGATYTERGLAKHLKVYATPTLVFLASDGTKALQLTGYRDPRALRQALEYVQSRRYGSQSFPEFVAARNESSPVYTFRHHPQFSHITNFKGYRQPLAILFEDRNCAECARFHDKTLNHPDVIAELKRFRVVRLDAHSTQPIVDLDGNATTPAAWVKSLGLSYRPAVVLFDEGREVFRVDGRLYHFHFKETLRYVGGGFYKRYGSISKYNAARREELLSRGIDIDYSE